jgi:maltooligosyltrehalose trehalohydrolase
MGCRIGQGGINVRWRTARGRVLQIIANFANEDCFISEPIRGELVWQSNPFERDMLMANQIVVAEYASLSSVPGHPTQ